MNRQQFQNSLNDLTQAISLVDLAQDTSNGGRPRWVIETDVAGNVTLADGQQSGVFCEYDQGLLARDARQALADELEMDLTTLEESELSHSQEERLEEIEQEFLANLVTVWLEDGDAWRDFQAWEARQPPLPA